MDEIHGTGPGGRKRRPRGTVRQAAMQAALAAIEQAGVPSFSLREIAGEIGVVHSALYRHFPNRVELIAAVAEQGFRDFLGALESAESSRTAGARLKSLCRTHLAFALANGALYKVMFGPDVVPFDVEGTAFHAAAAAVFNLAVGAIADCQRAGFIAGDEPLAPALVFWSTLHGLALLAIDGRLGPKLSEERSVEHLLDLAIDKLMRGFRAE